MTEHEMQSLKDSIRKKYEMHRLAMPGKYPALKFNSYPAPYEHLRTSFREELTSHGQAEMKEALAAIPSAKTWAKIFYDGYVLKDDKVLNTCYLYAWGKPRDIAIDAAPTSAVPGVPTATPKTAASVNWTTRRNLLFAGLAIGIGGLIYVVSNQYTNELVINSPASGTVVPRLMIVEGKAPEAKFVWPIIHPLAGPSYNSPIDEYYVQDPIKVADDGTWKGIVYVGGIGKAHVGVRHQLRVFINPAKSLLEDQLIYSWPKAERSSTIVEVVRGAEGVQQPTP